MNTTLEKQLIDLHDKISEAEDKLKALKSERQRVADQIIEAWQTAGLNQVKVAGRTVYLRTDRYAQVADKDAALRLLKRSPLARGVVQEAYNANTLSALVRNLRDERGALPDTWQGVIGVAERYDVRVLAS